MKKVEMKVADVFVMLGKFAVRVYNDERVVTVAKKGAKGLVRIIRK